MLNLGAIELLYPLLLELRDPVTLFKIIVSKSDYWNFRLEEVRERIKIMQTKSNIEHREQPLSFESQTEKDATLERITAGKILRASQIVVEILKELIVILLLILGKCQAGEKTASCD